MHFNLRTLGLSLLLVTCHVVSAYGGTRFEYDGIWYETVGRTTAKVIKPQDGISYGGRVTIPDQVEYRSSFYDVTEIGTGAFENCSDMNYVSIPVGITRISSDAFQNCTGLSYIVVPEGVTIIDSKAFNGCSRLAYAKLPKSLSTLSQLAFGGCTSLKSVVIYRTIAAPNQPACAFDSYDNVTFYVPMGCKELYTNPNPDFNLQQIWKQFKNIVELGNIVDGEVYAQNFYEKTDVQYTRTFNNTAWQPLFVPFDIPVDSLSAHGLKVAAFNEQQEGSFNMEFNVLEEGYVEPNWPYLIKADKVGEVSLYLDGNRLLPDNLDSIPFESDTLRFTFVGTYTGVSGKEMYNNKYYGMAGGSLKRVSSENVALRPQRWYLKVENLDGSEVKAPSIRFVVNESSETETTAISTVAESVADDALYTLSGLRVSAESVKPGLYVRNGKTIFIR